MSRFNIFTSILLISFLSLLYSCGRDKKETSEIKGNVIELKYAENISMMEISAGIIKVTLLNPWDKGKILDEYLLVDKNMDVPDSLRNKMTIIRTPISRSVVYSGVHVSLLDELGAYETVVGICDVPYVHDKKTLESVKTGKIADCGMNMTPNMEKIITLNPDAVLLSPYENFDGNKAYTKTAINLIQTADYMEKTPLGRAEWMKFYGRLYGKGFEADSLFNSLEKEYLALKKNVVQIKEKPVVVFDRIYSGVWDVPTSNSVTGKIIEDAGGKNPFSKYTAGGAAHLKPEEVLLNAGDADIWLIRHTEPQLTLKSLARDNKIYTQFKAFRNGNVYGANTLTTNLFEDGAFHPDRTLREMIRLLHTAIENSDFVYYKKLQ